MAKIVQKINLNEEMTKYVVKAPDIAKRAKPGQFIMLRIDKKGERVPFTISDVDEENVSIIVQTVGATTYRMSLLNEGDGFLDFVGPLGKPTELDDFKGKNVCVVGGGLGVAISYPQAKYLHNLGANVDVIVGFRTKNIIILEEELKANSQNLFIATDDGSYGQKGFVTDILLSQIQNGKKYDAVITVGPMIMMKNVAKIANDNNIYTIASMNSIMVDGTGMCGCCRLTVDGQMKFACVDGPDFDASKIDWNESMLRGKMYKEKEKIEYDHICNLTGGVRNGKI
ncbi:MAG: sulfide/dihydroorotate dehydrogenase-like FAD/NAD-binding protein [Peptoniphilaceae bacterium]|nr:sulfide/dihydroorotate dehydrogenase-like FAD/NAD-binding protein [Peptoniphilaceae bacterium]MDD7383023.1 sulfide/dihydroorotate dehydrogenase-like FAD/NAD-binding protein [Peptoniphilaceae bacterium]MDY3737774.1 sulfide/dihydroorotate dehydrogenase-like FAD/NAD-binding protein [Peptoniphilaceae bacterium]